MASETDTGRMGEFLASYILETFGIEVHHVSRDGADLWCKIRSDRIVTIDVKSSSAPSLNQKAKNHYRFTAKGRVPVDYYAFVALDKQLMIVRPSSEVTTRTVSIHVSNFNEALQRRTIEEMITAC